MKNKLLLLLCLIQFTKTIAKEGMWLPFLLETLNEKDMKHMGLKISAKDIYSENKSSLKDAVVLFGSGCTGEVVSKNGLVLTNHHCGYGTVQGLSSLQNDYLKNGFFAKNNQEEIPCAGLSVTFIVKIEDVTTKLLNGLSDKTNDTTRTKLLKERITALETETKKTTGYDAQVKSFFYENKFYLFYSEKYTDIRLVAFPPNSIGKFGGDADNWAWPRHTGDFSMFRIYANKNNKPSTFNKDNVAYVPKKYFTINTGGVKPNDFTMVYGFPGRTNEYISSGGVNEVMNVLDPARIKIREARLKIMKEDMDEDRSIFIKYASKQATIANYYKKWQGELKGLQVNDAVHKKVNQELLFTNWVNADTSRKNKYGSILQNINNLYEKQQQNMLLNEYVNEAYGGCEALSMGAKLDEMLVNLQKNKSIDSIKKYKAMFEGFYKNYNKETDRKISKKMLALFNNQFGEVGITKPSEVDSIFAQSVLPNKDKALALFDLKNADELIQAIKADLGYQSFDKLDTLQQKNIINLRKTQPEIIALYHNYIQAQQQYNSTQKMYPDANSTLRLSYGKVEGVSPSDGLQYNFYTTLDGVMQKENASIEEFEVPQKLKELYKTHNYGNYAMPNGKMPLAFLASNHTTGGNSGSPVLNAKGQLIGTNFDRIYEGTMSDIMYDVNLCRNITLDIRYTLFIIDKFGEASWLLNEMNIVKK